MDDKKILRTVLTLAAILVMTAVLGVMLRGGLTDLLDILGVR